MPSKQLFVLGCSATKVSTSGALPAISLYDGPSFRVFRTFLRNYRWPASLSVAVLSAKYGMVGGLSSIECYDQRMTMRRAGELQPEVTAAFRPLVVSHTRVRMFLGREYLASIDFGAFGRRARLCENAEGGIGLKLQQLRNGLMDLPKTLKRPVEQLPIKPRPLYFLPDWDDFVDADFDFQRDKFSSRKRSERNQQHTLQLIRPKRLADGILVSLAQNLGNKGLLRRVTDVAAESLAPQSVREHFDLRADQWAFGDCGAFSYVNSDQPTISVSQAVTAYDLHDFDLGASVDHIPIPFVVRDGMTKQLTQIERRKRVELTVENAQRFIDEHRRMNARFIPVGVLQGLDSAGYAKHLKAYLEMGYEHIALGGLVPRSDADVLDVVTAVAQALKGLKREPWIHLLGIFRPELQRQFRDLGINSFDSASYFRKAWLRADQNYLGVDGKWYAALRIPMTSDTRSMRNLLKSGLSELEVQALERDSLSAIKKFDKGLISVSRCLDAVMRYDSLLTRAAEGTRMRRRYEETLIAKPWKTCPCKVCQAIGIHVLIFRGLNRNKRRGAHNTLQLFESLGVQH